MIQKKYIFYTIILSIFATNNLFSMEMALVKEKTKVQEILGKKIEEKAKTAEIEDYATAIIKEKIKALTEENQATGSQQKKYNFTYETDNTIKSFIKTKIQAHETPLTEEAIENIVSEFTSREIPNSSQLAREVAGQITLETESPKNLAFFTEKGYTVDQIIFVCISLRLRNQMIPHESLVIDLLRALSTEERKNTTLQTYIDNNIIQERDINAAKKHIEDYNADIRGLLASGNIEVINKLQEKKRLAEIQKEKEEGKSIPPSFEFVSVRAIPPSFNNNNGNIPNPPIEAAAAGGGAPPPSGGSWWPIIIATTTTCIVMYLIYKGLKNNDISQETF